MLKLYSYFRSSASYRVRIALNLKKIDYIIEPIHLVNDGGEQFKPDYQKRNPQSLVPFLEDDHFGLHQSYAMLEYLEEKCPDPSLLPENIEARAYVRALAQMIVADLHPLNNLRVLQYLKNNLSMDDDKKNEWYQHWIYEGFRAIEVLLQKNSTTGMCCYGDKPTFADLCLIPQVYNANRFQCDLTEFPMIVKINDFCMGLPEFIAASPEQQPDAG